MSTRNTVNRVVGWVIVCLFAAVAIVIASAAVQHARGDIVAVWWDMPPENAGCQHDLNARGYRGEFSITVDGIPQTGIGYLRGAASIQPRPLNCAGPAPGMEGAWWIEIQGPTPVEINNYTYDARGHIAGYRTDGLVNVCNQTGRPFYGRWDTQAVALWSSADLSRGAIIFGLDDLADRNADGLVTVADVFEFLQKYAAGHPAADIDADRVITTGDVFGFLDLYFGG